MSSRIIPCLKGILNVALGSAFASFTTALAGFSGASIITKMSYVEYNPLLAAKMGSIGGSITGGVTFSIASALTTSGLFRLNSSTNTKFFLSAAICLIGTIQGGFTGDRIIKQNDTISEIPPLIDTFTVFALGGTIMMLPVACLFSWINYPFIKMRTDNFRRDISISELKLPPPAIKS